MNWGVVGVIEIILSVFLAYVLLGVSCYPPPPGFEKVSKKLNRHWRRTADPMKWVREGPYYQMWRLEAAIVIPALFFFSHGTWLLRHLS
jgi:hypothetical protein